MIHHIRRATPIVSSTFVAATTDLHTTHEEGYYDHVMLNTTCYKCYDQTITHTTEMQ